MNAFQLPPDPSVALFVKAVHVFEDPDQQGPSMIPFFADGYPGLIYHETPGGMFAQPLAKQMSPGFIYGQTLAPVEIHFDGPYRMIIFQFYPFVLNSIFRLDARKLNDDCYSLDQYPGWNKYEKRLGEIADPFEQARLVTAFLTDVFDEQNHNLDHGIKDAIQIMLNSPGPVNIQEISDRLYMSLRTFERRFVKETGISPRTFIQVTRFQRSFEQLTAGEFEKITDIVYDNGFADQSHFIRVFKAFTEKTPSSFIRS